jgi:hypothetical protein
MTSTEREAFEKIDFDFPPVDVGTLHLIAKDGAIDPKLSAYFYECAFAGWRAALSAATPEQPELPPLRALARKLLDVACRIRVRESIFRDDELVDEAAHALAALAQRAAQQAPNVDQVAPAVQTLPLSSEARDAARWRYIQSRNNEWRRYAGGDSDQPYAMLCVRLPYDADLSCKAMRDAAIDAAMVVPSTADRVPGKD